LLRLLVLDPAGVEEMELLFNLLRALALTWIPALTKATAITIPAFCTGGKGDFTRTFATPAVTVPIVPTKPRLLPTELIPLLISAAALGPI